MTDEDARAPAGAPFGAPSQRVLGVEQPAPVANDLPAVWGLVMKDMVDRDQLGRKRYGTPLQPHNGRDALRDAYEEALDLVVYMRQAIYERDNPPDCTTCGHLISMHSDGKCSFVHGWTAVACDCGLRSSREGRGDGT